MPCWRAAAGDLAAHEADDMRRRLRAKAGPSDRSADAVERDIAKVVGMVEAAEKEAGKLAWPHDVDELRRGLKRSQSRLRQSWKVGAETPGSRGKPARMAQMREGLCGPDGPLPRSPAARAEGLPQGCQGFGGEFLAKSTISTCCPGSSASSRLPAQAKRVRGDSAWRHPQPARRRSAPPPSRRARPSPRAPQSLRRRGCHASGTKQRRGLTKPPLPCNCSRNRFVLRRSQSAGPGCYPAAVVGPPGIGCG